MATHCKFCGKNGDFGPCSCGQAELIACAAHGSCPECTAAHRFVGKFLNALLKTERAERSNSVRQRLLLIFIAVIAVHKSALPHRGRYVFDILRDLNAFGPNEDFRASIREVLRSLPDRIFNGEFALTLNQKIAESKVELSLERLGIAVADVPSDQRAAVARFLGTLVVASVSVSPRNENVRGSSGSYRRSGRIVTPRGRQLGL